MVAIARPGLIGPNSVIQTVAALRDRYGDRAARAILQRGGLPELPDRLPSELIDEREFHALAMLLIAQLGPSAAVPVLREAGRRTADYVLANRIPAPARLLLRALPARVSLRLLLPAIARHAWTFAGSGAFEFTTGAAPTLSVASERVRRSPDLAAVVCSYYRGAFEQLLRSLAGSAIRLSDLECQADGDPRCSYRIELA